MSSLFLTKFRGYLNIQGQEAGVDAASEPSPTGRWANGCHSARSSAQDEPAMILFDEDDDPPPVMQQSGHAPLAGALTTHVRGQLFWPLRAGFSAGQI